MKTTKILQAAILIAFTTFAVSCTVSRPYAPYPPEASASLIINPYPGIVVNHYADGRYYYRSPQGYTYWRGYDNRYYLDRSYVGNRYHSHSQYNDWRNNGRRHRH